MADHRRERFSDLDITKDELNTIGEALKDKEFVNLLQDYYQEITDPENIKTYQNEMIQLEKERGIDCTFINPEAGYVIKSSVDGNRKAFINVCYNENVGKPSNEPVRLENGQIGRNWQIPHLLSPPRDDFSKNDTKTTICTVYDVVFHPHTMHLAAKFPEFRNMVTNTALDSVENKFNIKLDRNNLKYPKMKFKGNVAGRNPVIRKRNENYGKIDDDILEQMYPHPFNQSEPSKTEQKPAKTMKKPQEDVNSIYTTPKYSIKQLSEVDLQDYRHNMTCKFNATIPNELIVEIDLPLLNSTADTQLDVTEKSISLISETPAKYKLQIQLPYCVNEDIGNAKFDKLKRRLIVTLPVKRKTEPVCMKFAREDSGVDSDQEDSSSTSPPNELICELSSEENVPVNQSATKMETESILQVAGVEENVSVNSDPKVETELRTNPFLETDKEYIFPEYTYNIYKNTLAFTLHVKNVDPISVAKLFITNGVQIKFSSISSGFYPVLYAFCVQFPVTFQENDVTIETWDNNVIVQIPFEKDFVQKSFFIGLNDSMLEEVTLKSIVPNPNEVQSEELTVKTVYSDDEVTVEVTSSSLPKNIDSKFAEMQITEEYNQRKKLEKMHSYSESSGDELSVSQSPLKSKGILKYKRSTSRTINRSVSESSIDDMTWPNSLDNYHLGSDSCIPEEKEQCDNSYKKTVRFNDHVSKQIFRLNSSILGQKKKNQRKNRNKKRTNDRRHSESELSENEDKKDQFRKKPIFTNKDRQRPHSESELSETEHKEHYFNKKSALKNPINKKEMLNRQRSDSGVSSDTDNNKEHQKTPAAHKVKTSPSNIEFQSDLIFDIDM